MSIISHHYKQLVVLLFYFLMILFCTARTSYAPSRDIKVIPPIDYHSDHDWIAVPAGADSAQIKKLIRKEVESIIKSNKQVRYNKAITIFQNWMDEKAELNELWKKKMLELGTQLRDQVAEVSALRQESIQLKNRVNVKQTQLKALKQTLKNDSLSWERYENEKKFLRDNLEGQLEDINYMVVALGKRRLDDYEDLREILDIIGDKMMVKAIEDVNGTRIKAIRTVRDNKLIREYVKSTVSGHALALDSYTNDFAKLSDDNEDIRYLVQAIEVSPFKKKKAAKTPRTIGQEPAVHLITRANLDRVWAAENLDGDPTKTPIKDFIVRLLDQAEHNNREIGAKIEGIYASYQERLRDVEVKISTTKNNIEKHLNELREYQNEYQIVKRRLDSYEETTLNPAIAELKQIEANYSRHYNQRIFLADKTEEGKPEKRAIDAYKDFAALTMDKMKDIKEGEYTSTVVAVNYKLDSYSENLLTYTPRTRAFTILFLTKKELSTYVSYVACVGYQMELQPKEGIITIEKQKKITEPPPGMKFVRIPGGNFQMGSKSGDSDEEPVHRVNIKPFYIMTTEVTQAQWKAVMGNNPSHFKGDNLPVEKVSWNDCQEFIKKLNQRDPWKGYCLPSEAEWEYACRAGTTTKYYSGNSESDLKRVAWYYGNSGSKTHPVGQKQPNAYGLYDMHGNVWEWCEDWYHNSYNGAPINESAWVSPSGSARVLRGGSWINVPWLCLSANRYTQRSCRSASRGSSEPGYRSLNLGFRLARGL